MCPKKSAVRANSLLVVQTHYLQFFLVEGAELGPFENGRRWSTRPRLALQVTVMLTVDAFYQGNIFGKMLEVHFFDIFDVTAVLAGEVRGFTQLGGDTGSACGVLAVGHQSWEALGGEVLHAKTARQVARFHCYNV